MRDTRVIAVDLGASSGRVILASFVQDKLQLKEVYRFPNEGIRIGERLYTDILFLHRGIAEGIRRAWREELKPVSLGIDSWGVDFGVLDENGELIGNPYHYRDIQASGMMETADVIFGKGGLFRLTGIQDMWYNTVYQFLGIHSRRAGTFEKMQQFLMLPDILGYFLTGNKSTEYTSASTTQMYNTGEKRWSETIRYELGIDQEQMPEVVMTGTSKGQLTPVMKMWIGIPEEAGMELIATAEHDSASAAAAVPAEEDRYIFINSGTWSIIGSVLDRPVITPEVYEKGYSNEGAAFGRIKLVKSIMGMWFIQELRKSWSRQGKNVDYGFLISEAEKSVPFSHLIDVDDSLFTSPFDMEQAIDRYCESTGQGRMKVQGEYYRAVMESLAFQYREAIKDIEKITGIEGNTVYLLGGAVQDTMFCRFIAGATGKRVCAGPVEATAVGNALIQLKSLRVVKSEKDFPKLIKKSFNVCYYEPEDTKIWDQAYEKYQEMRGLRR